MEESPMKLNRTRKRTAFGLAGLLLLAFPLAACGDDEESAAPAEVKALAQIDDLSPLGGMTQITLDAGFLDAITGLGLAPAPTLDAKLDGAVITFPITGGNVGLFEPDSVPNYVVGQVQHVNSGLSLTAGDTVVELRNFNVDPTVSRVYGDVLVNGELAALSAYLFRLDGRTLKGVETTAKGDTVLEGSGVFISPVAADLLNSTFGTDAVTGELEVGIAKITVFTSKA